MIYTGVRFEGFDLTNFVKYLNDFPCLRIQSLILKAQFFLDICSHSICHIPINLLLIVYGIFFAVLIIMIEKI